MIFSFSLMNVMPVFAQLSDMSAPADATSPSADTEPAMDTVTPADTTPPVISDVMQASVSPTDATFMWTTDELATSTFEYGLTESYGTTADLGASQTTMHTTTIMGLTPDTIYYYCITATDGSKNTSRSCGHSFTTAAEETPADTNPPTVTEVSVSNITKNSADIGWTTDEVADGYVEYGMTPDYGSQTSLDTAYTTDHTASLSGLMPDTVYHYRVVSADGAGNVGYSSDNSFTTLTDVSAPAPEPEPEPETPPADTTPAPAPSAVISGVEVTDVTETSATIAWTTDIAADSQVTYGESSALGTSSSIDATLKTAHQITLTGLTPNTNYYFKVKSKAGGASTATVSALHDFNTLAAPVPVIAPANIIAVSYSLVSPSAVNISAATDKATRGQVEYGTTTEYGQATALADTATMSHTFPVSGLQPATLYHYRVKVIDEAGNITYSENYSFTTSNAPQGSTIPSPVISEVKIIPSVYAGGRLPPHTIDSSVIGQPTLLFAVGAENQVIFSWTKPAHSSTVKIRLVRMEGRYAISPFEGTKVYDGGADTFTDTGLTNGTTYYYTLYAYDAGLHYSRPIEIAVMPTAKNKEVIVEKIPEIVPVTTVKHFVEILKQGARDIEVAHLQEVLAADSNVYPEGYITGYFGPMTEAALKRFQTKHNLMVTGITDTATQKKLHILSQNAVILEIPRDLELFERNLHIGHVTPAVTDLQRFLAHEGSYGGKITGRYERSTSNAVKTFQKKYGVTPANGAFGPKTQHAVRVITGL